ncbi:trypsin-like serine protease [Scytonema sp. PCC 10023]|uniref:trypsin-like serine protease n=1 Tax=Scytonema sp. PCC 10023 TaxID=1680591 RepID=UPI0039C60D8D
MATLKHQSIAVVGAVLSTLGTAELAGAIVTAGDPQNYQVAPGKFSGVVPINTSLDLCTGSLLKGGLHILTAAHCITDKNGKFNTSILNKTNVTFKLPTGSVSMPVVDYFVHPGYDSIFYKGNDIAVLRLSTPAPSQAQQYDIYRAQDEVGKIFTQVGYGYIGSGNLGENTQSNLSHLGYSAINKFDALADITSSLFQQQIPGFTGIISGSQLLFDFDSGLSANDAFGTHFGINDLGLGTNEGNIAGGDSGGPAFINDLVAGIASYSFSDSFLFPNGVHTDLDKTTNSSFGELTATTRVSNYASFIDDAIAGKIPSAIPIQSRSTTNSPSAKLQTLKVRQGTDQTLKTIPEPTSILGMLAFGTAVCFLRKGQKPLARRNS